MFILLNQLRESCTWNISLAENHKGLNAVQRCSVEKQKGAIAIDFVQ